MILKIQGDFNNKKFSELIELLKKYFKFIFYNESLYIALKNFCDKDEAKIEIEKIFKKFSNFYVKEIDENNILSEDDEIVSWCKNNFVALDRQRFEIEQQEKLKKTWDAMDVMEDILRKRLIEYYNNLKNEKKGDADGNGKA